MIQQFIELGQGYGDIYELCELVKTNENRFHNAFIFTANHNGQQVASLAVAFKPAGESKFMPIYICREGIPFNEDKPSKRIEIFKQVIQDAGQLENIFEIKHSSIFSETNQYYQYLIGILRLNHYIPPMH
ncbi:methylthioribose kinase [Solibacillus sp. MA9]|uniref:Methylthioribose kinase n=1 Tax=Solibacillus palustris TaxID=2908203 RepID=A0ABS9U9U7_9BACL|nr:methylthioribose kinase [Solibacillus sp. MA9]MCH7320815.1 methylthioribose kinase [Solibacillus sp. MA9]